MKKFLTIVALLTVVTTPAFAQSFNSSSGTGNELPSHYQTNGRLVQDNASQLAARANGDNAFAKAPDGNANLNPYRDWHDF